jgi:hypothetical protein
MLATPGSQPNEMQPDGGMPVPSIVIPSTPPGASNPVSTAPVMPKPVTVQEDLLPSRPFTVLKPVDPPTEDRDVPTLVIPKPSAPPQVPQILPPPIPDATQAVPPKNPAPTSPPAASTPPPPAILPETTPSLIVPEEPTPQLPAYWLKLPWVDPMPRPGLFMLQPTSPGYYSLKDIILKKYREQPPPQPYPPFSVDADSFFNNDFRYIDRPGYVADDWLDPIKRLHMGDDWLFSPGGEFRYRYMSEDNSRLTGTSNDYNLLRARAYGDLSYQDLVRVYAEFIFADSYGQSLPPLAIDANRADFLNLFVDLNILGINGSPVVARIGRQELLFGSQRLISPLDWANTRRTFEGARAFWHGDEWNVDLFWVRPVVIDPSALDSWDLRRDFTGAWVTYKPKKGTTWDVYVLNLIDSNPVYTGQAGPWAAWA